MKIVLIKDVKNQGKKGNILDVKDGYGNFLISNGFAVLATSTSLSRLEQENKINEKKEQEIIDYCLKQKELLKKQLLVFKVKTGKDNKVFGSISSKQIIEELKKQGFNINKQQISLKELLSTLGIHFVDVELHKKVIAKLKINLVK